MSSHILDLLLKLSSTSKLGTLEDHMLKKVRGPISLIVLEPRTGVDPDPDGGGLGGEVRLGGDSKAIGEGGDSGGR